MNKNSQSSATQLRLGSGFLRFLARIKAQTFKSNKHFPTEKSRNEYLARHVMAVVPGISAAKAMYLLTATEGDINKAVAISLKEKALACELSAPIKKRAFLADQVIQEQEQPIDISLLGDICHDEHVSVFQRKETCVNKVIGSQFDLSADEDSSAEAPPGSPFFHIDMFSNTDLEDSKYGFEEITLDDEYDYVILSHADAIGAAEKSWW
eukprot:m.19386 g.19386  ORF g.19386 m.19386 type:complete len:209 (-) comp6555_c0_seq2:91-717(-)